MPLTPGAPVGQSMSELLTSYKAKGTLGTSKPKSKKAAIKQALAISYSNKRRKK